MKILLTNDDGCLAEGIGTLARVLSVRHEVYVCAPDRQRSAVSRAMEMVSPLTAKPVTMPHAPEVPCYAVNGYPVDCVRLALGNLFPWPDVVISGINHGANLGTDILYSGTVGAAHEAARLGIPAIAVSNTRYDAWDHFDTSAHVAMACAERLVENPLPKGILLNLNVPDVPLHALKGIRTAPLGIIDYSLPYEEHVREDGTIEYILPEHNRLSDNKGNDVDQAWTNEGWAVVTEITYDMTDYDRLGSFPVNGLLEDIK